MIDIQLGSDTIRFQFSAEVLVGALGKQRKDGCHQGS